MGFLRGENNQVMFTMIFLFSLGLRAALLPAVGGKLGWCQSDVGNSLVWKTGFCDGEK